MRIALVIPPKVNGKYVHREDKHVSFHDFPFVPYTAPLIHSLIENYLSDSQIEIIEGQRDNLDANEVIRKLDKIVPDVTICFLAWCAIPEDRKVAETKHITISIILQQWIDQYEAIKFYDLKSDYFLKNEIEMPLIEGLLEFQNTGIIRNTKGFLIHNDHNIIDTGDADSANLEGFPTPNFSAFNLEKYFDLREKSGLPVQKARMAYINSMKGCPFKCTFCGQSNNGYKVRYQSPDQVITQLKLLKEKYGIKSFEFIDNEFSIDLARAKEICLKIINAELNITFSIQDRMGYYDDKFIVLLREAGCHEIRIGIETCDPKLQEYLNKRLDLTVYKNDIKKIRDHKIKVTLYMTPGIPGETRESLKENAKFIAETCADQFTSGPLFLMPSTPLYKKLKEANKLLVLDWSEYRYADKLCYVNESYSDMQQIIRAANWMTRLVYLYKIKAGLAKGSIDISSLKKLINTTMAGKLLYHFFCFFKRLGS